MASNEMLRLGHAMSESWRSLSEHIEPESTALPCEVLSVMLRRFVTPSLAILPPRIRREGE
jgi:hypothetical protein